MFRTLTDHKWRDALRILSDKGQHDYLDLNKKLEGFAQARNQFTHEGWSWNLRIKLAEECVMCVKPLIQLYVDLHNAFIHIRPGSTWRKEK